MPRDKNGRFTRTPATFAQRVEAEVWADLESQLRNIQAVPGVGATYQMRALFLTAAIDTAAERLEWLGVPA